ncbi:hypothetical protein ACFWF7_09990 [Nocardia sp. NPDC060256]|uniref:hypothetical protein n=1 Tax=unclassified Nocardia TaxID=2637762 RepID=UPI00366587EA
MSEQDQKSNDQPRLALEYRDGLPVITVTGGNVIPGGIRVETDSGAPVAIYKAETLEQVQSRQARALGPDVLLTLFEEVPDEIELSEPPEGLSFGVDNR